MTSQEYIQLKAFARIDGVWLSLLWMATFALYIVGLTSPGYGLAALVLLVTTPFFVGSRLRHFRDDSLSGTISLMRGWAYIIYVFFYGGLLFALAQWAYLTYMDQGYLMKTLTQMLTTPEATEQLQQMGLADQLGQSLQTLGQMRPIDLSLNLLTTNILIGIILGLPIAAVLQKQVRGDKSQIGKS